MKQHAPPGPDTPPLSPALIRRIRRHVTGRVHTFFAVTAPGWERFCQSELKRMGFTENQVHHGGVVFTGKLPDCYGANLRLRTANRILMRLAEFKATGFRQLEKKLLDFPWELYFFPGFSLEISVSTKKSRLSHTGAIAERVDSSIDRRLGRERRDHPVFSQRVFVRVVSDRFTLSIDTSGPALYKRGVKTHGGRAPLRETGAAAILLSAGYRPGEILLDPMCGSGTFSLEAAMMVRNMPPGWFRDFAFMGWPAFRPRQWRYMRRGIQDAWVRPEVPCILASDQSWVACRNLTQCLEDFDLSDTTRVVCRDFFELSPKFFLDGRGRPGVVVFNPPFGRRLGTRRESTALIRHIGEKLKTDFRGWRFALLAPHHAAARGIPFPCDARPFHHGGLALTLLTGVVR